MMMQRPSWTNGSPLPPIRTIAPGTKITMQNWEQYNAYMPPRMIALFDGKYFWKMPDDVVMPIGPTIIYPLPKTYTDATEQYSSQVQIVHTPDGGYDQKNYQGGLPFPKPEEPDKSYKILANEWFGYVPHLLVVGKPSGYAVRRTAF
jgi:hypothetical protein